MRMAAPKLFSRATANTSFMLTRAGASRLSTRIFGLDMGMSAPNQAFVLLRNITKNGDAVRLLRMSLRFMCHLSVGRNGSTERGALKEQWPPTSGEAKREGYFARKAPGFPVPRAFAVKRNSHIMFPPGVVLQYREDLNQTKTREPKWRVGSERRLGSRIVHSWNVRFRCHSATASLNRQLPNVPEPG